MKKILSTILLLLVLTTLASAQANEQYLVNTKTLNMRSGAGKDNEIIATLTIGNIVTLIEKSDNGWWLMDFEGISGYVSSSFLKKDPYSGWEKKNYQSGDTPDCENITPQHDYNLDNYLRIIVGSGTDVVVKLMKIENYDDECIRIIYVRSNETYEIKYIPEDRYYLKIAYGKNIRQKIIDNQCIVKFMEDPLYEKGSDILDFNKIKQPNQRIGNDVYENWSVPSFELFLDVIKKKGGKSFKSNKISEAEFNK